MLFYGRQPEVNFKTDDSIVPGKILETIVALNKPVDRSHAGTPAGLWCLWIALIIEMKWLFTVVFHSKDDLIPFLLQTTSAVATSVAAAAEAAKLTGSPPRC